MLLSEKKSVKERIFPVFPLTSKKKRKYAYIHSFVQNKYSNDKLETKENSF